MSRPDIENLPPYNVLRQEYADKYSLGNLNTDINAKFALISLVCFLTYNLRKKKDSITHYQIVRKAAEGLDLPEDFLKTVAVVCADFGYNCKTFPTFNIQPKNMFSEIRKILENYLPF